MFIERLRGCSRDALRIEALLTLRLVRLPWIETKQWRQWQHWCSWNKEIVQHFEVKQCQAMRFEQKTTIQLWFKYFAPTLKGLEFDKPWRYDPRSCEFGYWICLDYAGWILSAHFNTTWVPDILTFQRHPGKGWQNQSLYVAFPGHSLTLFKHVQTICHLLVDSGTTRITIIY